MPLQNTCDGCDNFAGDLLVQSRLCSFEVKRRRGMQELSGQQAEHLLRSLNCRVQGRLDKVFL